MLSSNVFQINQYNCDIHIKNMYLESVEHSLYTLHDGSAWDFLGRNPGAINILLDVTWIKLRDIHVKDHTVSIPRGSRTWFKFPQHQFFYIFTYYSVIETIGPEITAVMITPSWTCWISPSFYSNLSGVTRKVNFHKPPRDQSVQGENLTKLQHLVESAQFYKSSFCYSGGC